ncbi:hypothetical protein EDD85DRAFT_826665 [Armillaria nabsnona]|nr:hypothetical protein EDD85DRAFT_826665 [Armillaria nabsnona]
MLSFLTLLSSISPVSPQSLSQAISSKELYTPKNTQNVRCWPGSELRCICLTSRMVLKLRFRMKIIEYRLRSSCLRGASR